VRGPIPDGANLIQLCLVRHCVNPNHLEVVTVKENVFGSSSTMRAEPKTTASKPIIQTRADLHRKLDAILDRRPDLAETVTFVIDASYKNIKSD
jgi:hypothetical protein